MNRTAYAPEVFDTDERKRGVPVLVMLWGTDGSRNNQRTVSPRSTVTVGRLNSMFFSVTVVVVAAAAGVTSAIVTARARRRCMRGVRLLLACGSLALAGCGSEDRRATAPATTAEPGGGLRYGAIGDSFSNGEAVGADRAWPVLLAQRLGLDLVVNPSVSGWTSEQALEQELPAFEQARPEVATLLIGANDLAQGAPVPAFRARLRRLLREMVRIVGAPRRVVAVTVPDFSRKPQGRAFGPPAALSRAIRRLNAVIRAESAAQGVAVADVFAVSRRPADPSPDGLHPSLDELEAWTDAIEPVARRSWKGLE